METKTLRKTIGRIKQSSTYYAQDLQDITSEKVRASILRASWIKFKKKSRNQSEFRVLIDRTQEEALEYYYSTSCLYNM